jgi:SAM-dependent methyltransferase
MTTSTEYMGAAYLDDQERNFERPRNSDVKIIDMVVMKALCTGPTISVLDVGCSTGALLYHLRQRNGDWDLSGCDVSPQALERARRTSALAGISFKQMSILKPSRGPAAWDVVVLSAVLQAFDDYDIMDAVKGMAYLVKPGGSLILFDWFHPFHQILSITEQSLNMPGGYTFYMRPYLEFESALRLNGFTDVAFQPFVIKQDLALTRNTLTTLDTHTVKQEDGERMCFRGALYQPWCHVTARKEE